jgi:hypothetical protein
MHSPCVDPKYFSGPNPTLSAQTPSPPLQKSMPLSTPTACQPDRHEWWPLKDTQVRAYCFCVPQVHSFFIRPPVIRLPLLTISHVSRFPPRSSYTRTPAIERSTTDSHSRFRRVIPHFPHHLQLHPPIISPSTSAVTLIWMFSSGVSSPICRQFLRGAAPGPHMQPFLLESPNTTILYRLSLPQDSLPCRTAKGSFILSSPPSNGSSSKWYSSRRTRGSVIGRQRVL